MKINKLLKNILYRYSKTCLQLIDILKDKIYQFIADT